MFQLAGISNTSGFDIAHLGNTNIFCFVEKLTNAHVEIVLAHASLAPIALTNSYVNVELCNLPAGNG